MIDFTYVIGLDEYDVVIDPVDGITSEKWPIYVSDKILKSFPSRPSENQMLARVGLREEQVRTYVGVFGKFNQGKTFLINKLAGRNLDSSRRISTKGICILYPASCDKDSQKARLAFLDIEGNYIIILFYYIFLHFS